MKIFKIEVENYRLLKNITIELEDELSLVIGKNNTGKTSLLLVLQKFLNQTGKFNFDDFNIDFKKEIKELLEEPCTEETNYKQLGIKLKLFIQYNEEDNLSNLSQVMMDLDPENTIIVLGFQYALHYSDYENMKTSHTEFEISEKEKKTENNSYEKKGTYDFIKNNLSFFKLRKFSFEYDLESNSVNELNFIDLDSTNISIKEIINFKYISANRDVSNSERDHTLSTQTSKLYEKTETSDKTNEAIEKFKDTLGNTDVELSNVYAPLFHDVIKKVKLFGGIKENESKIEIISTLQHRELLKGNTTVVYNHDNENKLPEYFNGLGYMNLISMIFEIELKVQEFKSEKDRKPSDINLLFIEEPEAHTHPQMQYVFIKNIKTLLKDGIKREDGENRKLQYIISTHSSHIVADSDFNDIKYLKKENANSVIAKNLKNLDEEYEDETPHYQFLKQYLTISRAEIFFADKAILIEGDTERILLPTMMKKIDIEEKQKFDASQEFDDQLPLLSQNISIIEVGAYSQIFEKFIDFLGMKSLLITDLDATNADGNKCKVAVGENYSNTALSYFFHTPSLNDLIDYTFENKLFTKNDSTWTNQSDGKLCIVYQLNENEFNARSFEDAFIHINKEFITSQIDSFQGLKNKGDFSNAEKDAYDLAESCIKKKTHFALDILYHSNIEFTNWQIPKYIIEGLLWLKAD